MRKIATLLLVIPLGLAAGGLVAVQTIRQHGRLFSIDSVTIKAGGSLTFLNDDNVPHNIASISKGNEFSQGSDLHFLHHPVAMGLNGTFGPAQRAGDLLVGRDRTYR